MEFQRTWFEMRGAIEVSSPMFIPLTTKYHDLLDSDIVAKFLTNTALPVVCRPDLRLSFARFFSRINLVAPLKAFQIDSIVIKNQTSGTSTLLCDQS
jgi:hypothetical protein